MADDLDFDLNLQIDNTQYQYIIASGTSLTTTVRSNVKTNIIGVNSIYTKTAQLKSEQLLQEMTQIIDILLTIEKRPA